MGNKHCGNCQAVLPPNASTCPQCGQEVPRGFFASLGALFGGKAKETAAPAALPPPISIAASGPFAFLVEDIFTITGRGTVVTGMVQRGEITVGEEVAFTASTGEVIKRRITGIELLRKTTKVASEGQTAGLLLSKDVDRKLLVPGVVLARA
jgi:translation elongation factor EF-Tu-like GTPase